MAVLWAPPVAADFHARFGATARHYTYLLVNAPVRPALLAGSVGWYHRPLDVAAMAAASAVSSARTTSRRFAPPSARRSSPVKTLTVASLAASGDTLRFDFSANAFLHHMIRNIVGALV